jgi:transcriptional repressor NrdR
MKCVYCKKATNVTNSRHQKRMNSVWRRRHCQGCGAIFTSIESPDLSYSVQYKDPRKDSPEPFSRDKLLISIFESCKHRKSATSDATALTDTIIGKISPYFEKIIVDRSVVIQTTLEVLERFDRVSATYYRAYHQD